MSMVIAAALLAGAGLVERAEAGDRRGDRGRDERRVERRIERRVERRIERRVERRARYFDTRDIYVIREYYRPHHRALSRGARPVYVRSGHLPPGWARRVRPIPVYVERRLPVLPHGYRRGIIDGHAVVYNASGLIIDVAVLF
jgi:hypothetical protein